MFYGLATDKLDTGDLKFTHVLKDIQTLNEEAFRGTYDVTAISFHAYAYISDKYVLLPHGAPVPDGLPGDATVLGSPASDPDDAFGALVGAYAAALDRGLDAATAFRTTIDAAGGWSAVGD